jgi:hypothetical protein
MSAKYLAGFVPSIASKEKKRPYCYSIIIIIIIISIIFTFYSNAPSMGGVGGLMDLPRRASSDSVTTIGVNVATRNDCDNIACCNGDNGDVSLASAPSFVVDVVLTCSNRSSTDRDIGDVDDDKDDDEVYASPMIFTYGSYLSLTSFGIDDDSDDDDDDDVICDTGGEIYPIMSNVR